MLHVFIVSLTQDVEKREVISQILKGFGIKYNFVNAVYGKELSENILNSFRRKSKGKITGRGFPATPGEVGCTLSHIDVYKKIVDSDIAWSCILEDDAILDERFENFIRTFKEDQLSPKSLYLLGGQNGFPEAQVVKSRKNAIEIGGQKFDKTIRSEKFLHRTCCYIVSSQMAKDIVELSSSAFILADDWEYLKTVGVIERIYLSNFVDHPIDLSASHLQIEREHAASNKTLVNVNSKTLIVARIKHSIKWRLRLLVLNTYKYLEKKKT